MLSRDTRRALAVALCNGNRDCVHAIRGQVVLLSWPAPVSEGAKKAESAVLRAPPRILGAALASVRIIPPNECHLRALDLAADITDLCAALPNMEAIAHQANNGGVDGSSECH